MNQLLLLNVELLNVAFLCTIIANGFCLPNIFSELYFVKLNQNSENSFKICEEQNAAVNSDLKMLLKKSPRLVKITES